VSMAATPPSSFPVGEAMLEASCFSVWAKVACSPAAPLSFWDPTTSQVGSTETAAICLSSMSAAGAGGAVPETWGGGGASLPHSAVVVLTPAAAAAAAELCRDAARASGYRETV